MADDVERKIVRCMTFLQKTDWMCNGGGKTHAKRFQVLYDEIVKRLQADKSNTVVTILLGIYEWLADSANKIDFVCSLFGDTSNTDDDIDEAIDGLVAGLSRHSPFADLTDPMFEALESTELTLEEKQRLLRYCQYFLDCATRVKDSEEQQKKDQEESDEDEEQ